MAYNDLQMKVQHLQLQLEQQSSAYEENLLNNRIFTNIKEKSIF